MPDRPGRPRKQGGPTKNLPVRVDDARRDRYARFAAFMEMDTASSIRAVMDAACDAAGIP